MARTFTFKNTALILCIGFSLLLSIGCKKYNPPALEPVEDPNTLPVVTLMWDNGPRYYITNSIGKPNNQFTIEGRNFSKNFKDSKVLLNDLSVDAVAGDSTKIVVVVPDNAPIGLVSLTVLTNGKKVTFPNKFTIEPPNPKIEQVNIEGGMVGSRITIIGDNFSNRLAGNKVTVNGVNATVVSADLRTVVFTVPQTAGVGKLVLNTHGVALTYNKDFTTLTSTFTQLSPTTYNYGPRWTSLDGAGNLYGFHGNTVVKIAPDGTASTIASVGGTSTVVSGAVADAAGNVYAASPYDQGAKLAMYYTQNNSKIYKVTPSGTVSVLAGGNTRGYADGQGTNALFYNPTQLAIDAAGNIYVHDNLLIRKITPAGDVSTLAGNNNAGSPVDGQGTAARFGSIIAMNGDKKTGDLYVIETTAYNNTNGDHSVRLRKISAGGLVSTPAIKAVPGALPNSIFGRVMAPAVLSVDPTGAIYVITDISVYKIKDGVATNAYLNLSGTYPVAGAFDAAGKFYLTAAKTYTEAGFGTTYAVYKITL